MPQISKAQRDVLEHLRAEARRTGDDWGTDESIGEYLDDPEDDRSPRQYLNAVHKDVMWNYGHVGDDNDPDMDIHSAKRAQVQISRAMTKLDELEVPPAPKLVRGRLVR